MRFKLFSPPKLSGRFLHEADGPLTTGHLTRGPWVEKLRRALAEKFEWDEDKIVLGSSATTCFRALCLYAREAFNKAGAEFYGGSYWPLLREEANESSRDDEDMAYGGRLRVFTEIGGRSPDVQFVCQFGSPSVVDACHSWVPNPEADFSLVSFYPTKFVAGAEGGGIFCKQEWDAFEIQTILDCGYGPDSWKDIAEGRGRNGTRSSPAIKGHMTDVQAALNLEALLYFERYVMEQGEAWARLMSAAEGFRCLELAKPQPIRPYLFQMYSKDPDRVIRALAEVGVPATRNFPPSPWVTLPCHKGISDKDARDIVALFLRADEGGAA